MAAFVEINGRTYELANETDMAQVVDSKLRVAIGKTHSEPIGLEVLVNDHPETLLVDPRAVVSLMAYMRR